VSFITASVTRLTQIFFHFHNRTVLPDICFSVTCTLLRLTTPKRNLKLKLLFRAARFWLDLLRSRNDALYKRPHFDAEDIAGWLLL